MPSINLRSVTVSYFLKDDHLYVENFKSGVEGKGDGTLAVKELVRLSIENQLDGNIRLSASWSSHLFWLYMGMIPVDSPLGYVATFYGDIGKKSIEKLQRGENLGSLDVSLLISMLKEEKKDQEYQQAGTPLQTVMKNKELLLSLNSRQASFLRNKFIPDFLATLKANIAEKRPDTSSLGSTNMILSEQGKKRWKEAIEENKSFKPFKDLAHLREFMKPEEMVELDQLLQQLHHKPFSANTTGLREHSIFSATQEADLLPPQHSSSAKHYEK